MEKINYNLRTGDIVGFSYEGKIDAFLVVNTYPEKVDMVRVGKYAYIGVSYNNLIESGALVDLEKKTPSQLLHLLSDVVASISQMNLGASSDMQVALRTFSNKVKAIAPIANYTGVFS